MKKIKIFSLSVVSFILASFTFNENFPSNENAREEFQSKVSFAPYNDQSADNLPRVQEKHAAPDLERWYFEQWNYPLGSILEPEMLKQVWSEIESLPSETEVTGDAVNSWRMIGPLGSTVPSTGARFSGRVVDIEVGNSINPIIASASGGLWSYIFTLPYCLNNQLSSLACGSFTTHPANANIILLGTGEPSVRGGTGLWRSTNSGTTWTNIIMSPVPSAFYRIRHQTSSTSIVHAATTSGYYRSTNSGLNWTRTLSGNVSDVVINPSNPNTLYAGKWGDGIYKSTNNGVNWTEVTAPGLPGSDMGRIALTMGTSNSNKIYASIAKNSDDNMLGVYMTSNDGANWSNVSPPENIFGGTSQGWYDNEIGVCPTNSNIVIAGGIRLWRSTNSGTSWTEIIDNNVHSDQHAIEWTSDGNTVYVGNDGGVSSSTNQGLTFDNVINYLPITQYVNFDVGVSNRGVIYGGSQDNGFTGTTDGGTSWAYTSGGDGGGLAIDPFSALFIYGTRGYYTGSWAFKRSKSTDKGLTWTDINNGVDPEDQWYTKMRSDRTSPIKLYTNSGPYVYYSSNQGSNWTKLNPVAFPANVANVNVSRYVSPGAIVYASISSSTAGQRLRVYENGNFAERSTGFPSGRTVRGVATHITNTSKAYALMNGYSTGDQIYKTTNRGINWTNITGNLPSVAPGDIVPHPTNDNLLYLGTQMGCYKTTNGGVNWLKWNNGLPDAAIVTEMKWIDSTIENGRFYVVASTYGRSFWVRDVSGDDPVNTLNLTSFIQGLYQPDYNLTRIDTVRVYLRSSSSPFAVIDSAKDTPDFAGHTIHPFYFAEDNENYYLHVKHRNSIETWSATPVSFNNHALTYDFTNTLTQAFGNNMIQIDTSPVEYGIYTGDVNQDGTVNLTDILNIYNDASNFVTGYTVTDVTGDDIVDLNDLTLTYNNSNVFVAVVRP